MKKRRYSSWYSKKHSYSFFSKKYWYNVLLKSFRLQFFLLLFLILIISIVASMSFSLLASPDSIAAKFYNKFVWGFFQTIDSGSIPETIGLLNNKTATSSEHYNTLFIIIIACFSWLFGTILFNLITSAFTNFLELRKENLKLGNVRFKFRDHVVIIGWDFQGLAIVEDALNHGDEIVIITTQSIADIRNELRKYFDEKTLQRVFLYYGFVERDEKYEEKGNRKRSELEWLWPQCAKYIYILGEPNDIIKQNKMNRIISIRIRNILHNLYGDDPYPYWLKRPQGFIAKICGVHKLVRKYLDKFFDQKEVSDFLNENKTDEIPSRDNLEFQYRLTLDSDEVENPTTTRTRCCIALFLFLKIIVCWWRRYPCEIFDEVKVPNMMKTRFRNLLKFLRKFRWGLSEPIQCYIHYSSDTETPIRLKRKYELHNEDYVQFYLYNFYSQKAFEAISDFAQTSRLFSASRPLFFRTNAESDHVHVIVSGFNEMARNIVLQSAKSIITPSESKITIFAKDAEGIEQFTAFYHLNELKKIKVEYVNSYLVAVENYEKLKSIITDLSASVSLFITDDEPATAMKTYHSLPDFMHFQNFRLFVEQHSTSNSNDDDKFVLNRELPEVEFFGNISAPNKTRSKQQDIMDCYSAASENNTADFPSLYDDYWPILWNSLKEICHLFRAEIKRYSSENSNDTSLLDKFSFTDSMKSDLSQNFKTNIFFLTPANYSINPSNTFEYKIDDFCKFYSAFPGILKKLYKDWKYKFIIQQTRRKVLGICPKSNSDNHDEDRDDAKHRIQKFLHNQNRDIPYRSEAPILFCPDPFMVKILFTEDDNLRRERDILLVLPSAPEVFAHEFPEETRALFYACLSHARATYVLDNAVPADKRCDALKSFIYVHSDETFLWDETPSPEEVGDWISQYSQIDLPDMPVKRTTLMPQPQQPSNAEE